MLTLLTAVSRRAIYVIYQGLITNLCLCYFLPTPSVYNRPPKFASLPCKGITARVFTSCSLKVRCVENKDVIDLFLVP